jgi:hypothetical protein
MTEDQKQTEHLRQISNNLKFFFWLAVVGMAAKLAVALSQIAFNGTH